MIRNNADYAIDTVNNARATLLAGFTTVRNLGDDNRNRSRCQCHQRRHRARPANLRRPRSAPPADTPTRPTA